MAEEHVQKRLAALLAADVVGYPMLIGEVEVKKMLGSDMRVNAKL